MPKKKRRSPRPTATPRPAPPTHKTVRSEAEIARLLDATERAMLYRMGRVAIGRLLTTVAQTVEPFPLRTVDDYMRRVRERWAAEAAQTRGEVKEMAVRRIYKTMQDVVATKDYKTLLGWDQHLARVQGTLATVAVEVTGAAGAPLMPRTEGNVLDDLRKLVENLGQAVGAPGDPPKAS